MESTILNMNENGMNIENLNDTVIDVPEEEIIELNTDETLSMERREDGYYYTLVPVYLPLPNEEEFHAALLLPLLLNCAGVPLSIEENGENSTIGIITSNIGINQEEGVFVLEVRLNEPTKELLTKCYTISVEADVPNDIKDKDNEYSHKDLLKMTNVLEVTLTPSEESKLS